MKMEADSNMCSKYQTTDTSLCIRDISRLVPSEGEGIQKHAKQFLKQAGGVLLQRRSHAA
jgi:hypothetical protein